MKKILLSSILLLNTYLFANTTMCFKENHKSLTTIESTPVDGGECAGKYSLNDMKNIGWSVSDIKISGSNFIYVLKKDNKGNNNKISQSELEATILATTKEQEDKKKIEKEQESFEKAKKLYIAQCKNCHGEKGEISKGGSKLNILSEDKMIEGFKDYILGTNDKANSVFAPIHINHLNDSLIKDIKKYLDSLK